VDGDSPAAVVTRKTPAGRLGAADGLWDADQGAGCQFPQHGDPGHERHAFDAVQGEVFDAHSRGGVDQIFGSEQEFVEGTN
jgi:hypothetical protein